jgi:hypothetical protein
MPAAKRDHTWVRWTRAGFEPGGAKAVYYASAQEDGIVYDPGLGVLADADYTPVGFVNEEYGSSSTRPDGPTRSGCGTSVEAPALLPASSE